MAIQRALLSVSDKTGIVEFAKQLEQRSIEILSTGGTAKLLREKGVTVTDVSEYTGSPEIMDGRVKTLHPKIHGALLGRLGQDDSLMAEQGIIPIGLVVVNLYPFQQTISDNNCTLSDAIENIDIGGPTMIRAAAKNHAHVGIVVNNQDFAKVIAQLEANDNKLSNDYRFSLAQTAFAHTAQYDGAIANYLGALDDKGEKVGFPKTFNSQFVKQQNLRYGENPHQQAAFYVQDQVKDACIATASSIQGKALSYNNIADADAALECVKNFHKPACVIVKHANPCGVALGEDQITAYQRAFATDKTSAFGGIIAFNGILQAQTAEAILNQQFVEVIIAPDIEEAAKAILASKPSVRVLSTGMWSANTSPYLNYKRVRGGLLVQDNDQGFVTDDDIRVVTKREPTAQEIKDLLFAWKVVKYVKSNAIVYAKESATVGIGAGQMSRVYSARVAGIKAADEGLEIAGSAMASDAFFPFRDGIDTAHEMGVTAIIQPGGSIRDEEIIKAADENDLAMVFTGMRHFLH